MTKIGVDTSVLVGLFDTKDVWHEQAVALHTVLQSGNLEAVYFDCAIAEAISTLARRLHEKRRDAEFPVLLDQMQAQFPADVITWILPDVPFLYDEVVNLVRSSTGELNFNDALMALACRERDIPALASFDGDFDMISWLMRLASPEDVRQLLAASERSAPDESNDTPG